MPDVNILTWLVAGIKRRLTYTKTARRHSLVGPPDQWKQKRDFQRSFLLGSGLQPSHQLLDIGCGTLRGGIPLIEYLEEGNYVGLEPREKALDKGKAELREAGLSDKEPLLIQGDTSSAEIARRFDVIWAFSVLFHMTDNVLDDTLRFVQEHLAAKGVFYANVKIGDQEDKEWMDYPVVWRTPEAYETACRNHGLSVEDLGPIGELGHETGDPTQDEQRMLKIQRSG
jgi:SAM-dependent methyltransferase